MTIDLSTILTAGSMIVGLVVWLVRLEGRINTSEARFIDLKGSVEEIKSDVKALLRGGRGDRER